MPPRLALAPGLRVLDRGGDKIQIGLSARHQVRLAADPALRRVLAALDRGEAVPTDPRARRALARLQPAVVAADRLAPTGIGPGDVAAVALRDRTGYADRLARRGQIGIRVLDALGGPLAASGLLRAAGFEVRADDGDGRADVILLLTPGEPDRALLDPWVRDGIPHLVVRAVEGDLVVGPLVVPGVTACLRCLDAHHGADDPLYPVLASRHHRAVRSDGVPEPLDSALAAIAVGWAVRDLTSFLDGEGATTWSSTVRLGQEAGEVTVVSWLRHPGCGCAWVGAEGASDTMEA